MIKDGRSTVCIIYTYIYIYIYIYMYMLFIFIYLIRGNVIIFGGNYTYINVFSTNVNGFEKTRLPRIIRHTNFNYLKYYNSERKTDACMRIATIL